jgi:hypothetical protein
VTGTGNISIANTVTAGTTSGITFNEFGSITGTTALVGSDLPVATTTTVGGVIVNAVDGLEVDASGNISIADSSVVAGTYGKVTVNGKGIVTAATSLEAADIPNIGAEKLTTGLLSVDRIGANVLTGEKLADLSTVKIGGSGSSAGVVTFPTADFTGQFFFDAVTLINQSPSQAVKSSLLAPTTHQQILLLLSQLLVKPPVSALVLRCQPQARTTTGIT